MAPKSRKRAHNKAIPSISVETSVEDMVDKALKDAGITQTQTKSDWCLRRGLLHICSVNDGHLLPLVAQHGPPTFYHSTEDHCKNASTDNIKAPSNAFESLCRIIAGQQLAGGAAQAIWQRLLETTNNNLTPETILSLIAAGNDGLVTNLQKPAGLSLAKARSIVDLSHHFVRGDLSDELLQTACEERVREALLQVTGLGPWSVDMYLMFSLEKSNVLPVGDLGVRKGIAKAFALSGSAKKGALCQKKDLAKIQETARPFAPYQSLLSFYMWKAADTVDFYNSPSKKQKPSSSKVVTP